MSGATQEPVIGAARGQARDPVRVLAVLVATGLDLGRLGRALDAFAAQGGGPAGEPADVVVVLPDAVPRARELARGRGVQVVVDPGRGLPAAVNAGLACAGPGHRYAIWTTEDDEVLPGALAVAVQALEARPDAVLAYGDCRHLAPDGEYVATVHPGALTRRRLGWRGEGPAPAATVLRIAAVSAVGGFAEDCPHTLDLDLLLRLRRRGAFVSTGRTLAVLHADPQLADAAATAAARAEVVRVRRAVLPAALRPAAPAWERVLRGRRRDAQVRALRTAPPPPP